jgi:hypothetical protein
MQKELRSFKDLSSECRQTPSQIELRWGLSILYWFLKTPKYANKTSSSRAASVT